MTKDIKIGKPQRLGPLEVWPLMWEGLSDEVYDTPPFTNELKFEEYDDGDGPRVSCIAVENLTDKDFLIPSGWIVGAELLQVRCFNSAELVPAGHSILADVSCVEQGRWSMGVNRRDAGRAPLTVMSAGYDFEAEIGVWRINTSNRQLRVWNQVARQESRSGTRQTNSLEQIMREDAGSDSNVSRIQNEIASGLKSLHGQNGSLIAFQGEPLIMEFFSNEQSSKHVLRETLNSLAFDLDRFEFRPLDKTQVDEFIEMSGVGKLQALSDDAWTFLMAGGNERIDTQATADSRQKIMNSISINRSHRILMEV